MKRKIVVGVLLDNYKVNLWEYRILKKISDSDFAEIKLILWNCGMYSLPDNSSLSFIYKTHEKLDSIYFRNKFDYNKKIDILKFISDLPGITIASLIDFKKDSIYQNINNLITGQNIDVILNLGVDLQVKKLLKPPKYGIWSYKLGDTTIIKGFPAGYWEIVKNFNEIGGYISMRSSDDSETVIYQTSVSTYSSSINLTRDQLFALASLIIPRLIKALFLFGNSYIENLIIKYEYTSELRDPILLQGPSSFVAFKNLFSIIIKYINRKVLYLNPDPWFIIYTLKNNSTPFETDFNNFRELRAPKGKFWADPFVIAKNNKYYIFLEEYIYKKDKGHLSVLELNDKGVLLGSEIILNRQYHMSYPFIFEIKNEYYMIPETMANKTIDLYRCTNFPNKWEFVRNMMGNVSAVDSTLFYYGEKWWLFTSIDETEIKTTSFTELFLFFSDDLFSGNWQSHPLNPIITDVKTSRSAGRIINLNNKIYRPSQDCSGRYGRALNINQITTLSETEYEEVLVKKIEPKGTNFFLGVHTFNFNNDLTAMDASSRERRINFQLLKERNSFVDTFHNKNIERGEGGVKIKILFFIDELTSGGKERRLTELMKGLKLLPDIDFELVLMNKQISYKEVHELGIRIHYLLRKTKKDISIFSKFYVICRNYKPDIVHCWDSMTAIYLIPACKMLNIKIINGMVVDTPVQQNIFNKNWFRARISFPFSYFIVGNSNAGLSAYKTPPQKSICIYNGMDLSRFENLKAPLVIKQEIFGNESHNIFVLGMVAAFQPRKDYKTLIQAAITLLSTTDCMRFVLVGSGPDIEEIKGKVPHNLLNKVIFLGNRSDVESIVNIFDVGILLTNSKVHGEGISNSIIEYMALGKPVIATRGGGTDEVVIENQNGFLIDPENVDQLVEKVTFYFENKKLTDEFGKNGRKMVEEIYDVKIMTKKYLKLYEKISS